MKIFLIFQILLFSVFARSGEGCFYKHVKEALELNLERMPKYQALDSRGLQISRKLIRMEKQLLPVAKFFDFQAKSFQSHDLGLMCDEFVDIALTPAFGQISLEDVRPIGEDSRPYPPGGLKDLKMWIREKRYTQVAAEANRLVEFLEFYYPQHFCLIRHFLESIRRIAFLAPGHIERAKALGIKKPTGLIQRLLFVHRAGLWLAQSIDRRSIPLQNKGIPIVCNDVPHIPMEP